MIEGVLSGFVEIGIAVASFVAQVALSVLSASIRPWRYVLSPRFRVTFNAEFEHRSPIARWFALVWGSVALITSLVVVVGVVWLGVAALVRTDFSSR